MCMIKCGMPIILINGTKHHLPGQPSVAEAIAQLGMGGQRIAVECNGQIVPRSQHAGHVLHEGDRIEIVTAVGGG